MIATDDNGNVDLLGKIELVSTGAVVSGDYEAADSVEGLTYWESNTRSTTPTCEVIRLMDRMAKNDIAYRKVIGRVGKTSWEHEAIERIRWGDLTLRSDEGSMQRQMKGGNQQTMQRKWSSVQFSDVRGSRYAREF